MSETSTSSSPSRAEAARTRLPPSGIASRALITRFRTACLNFSASSGTRGRADSGCRSVTSTCCRAACGPISRTTSSRDSTTSVGRTVRRWRLAKSRKLSRTPLSRRTSDLTTPISSSTGLRRGRVAQPLLQELDVDAQRRQRVLDLVVQPGGQRAQAEEPLHPPDPLLHQDAVAHVAQEHDAAERPGPRESLRHARRPGSAARGRRGRGEILVPDRRVALGDPSGQLDQRRPDRAEPLQRLADTLRPPRPGSASRPS